MDYILILGVFEALLLSLLLFLKKQRKLPDTILGFIFLLFAIHILLSFFEIRNRQNGFPITWIIHTTVPLLLLHGPGFWFYIKAQTTQNFRFKPIYILHFLPFIALFLDQLFEIYLLPIDQKVEIVKTEAFRSFISYYVSIVFLSISSVGYFVWGLFMISAYKKKIKNYFSEIKNIDLHWLKTLLISAIGFYSFIYLAYIFDLIFRFTPPGLLQFMGFIVGSLFILFLGFYGHKQGTVFTSVQTLPDIRCSKKEDITQYNLSSEDELFINRLIQYMEEFKPHLNPELTISNLAESMNTSVEYLSETLNSRLNRNFFDFINHYRIEEFKQRCNLTENKNITLLGIAFDCGFNSKATFNRVFKNATGKTPSEFKSKTNN